MRFYYCTEEEEKKCWYLVESHREVWHELRNKIWENTEFRTIVGTWLSYPEDIPEEKYLSDILYAKKVIAESYDSIEKRRD